jgi:hypothetical protein
MASCIRSNGKGKGKFDGRQTHPRPLPCHLPARGAQAGGDEERRHPPLIRGGPGRGLRRLDSRMRRVAPGKTLNRRTVSALRKLGVIFGMSLRDMVRWFSVLSVSPCSLCRLPAARGAGRKAVRFRIPARVRTDDCFQFSAGRWVRRRPAESVKGKGNTYGVGVCGMPFPQLKLGVIFGMSLRDMVRGFSVSKVVSSVFLSSVLCPPASGI